MRSFSALAAASLTALLLAGCAGTRGTPAPLPILSLGAFRCATTPVLDAAPQVEINGEKPPLKIEFTATAPCIEEREGVKSAYAAVRLPIMAEPYLLSVSSAPQGGTLFSPRLVFADAQGRKLRERDRSTFTFRGAVLQTNVRAQPEEQFLIIESDPASIGQQISRITGNVTAQAVAAGGGTFILTSGSESSALLTQAHNGVVTVTARPLPKVE
jgi:hypothetical protein